MTCPKPPACPWVYRQGFCICRLRVHCPALQSPGGRFPCSPQSCCVSWDSASFSVSSHIHFINQEKGEILCGLAIRIPALIMTPSLFLVLSSMLSLASFQAPDQRHVYSSSSIILITIQSNNKTTTAAAWSYWVLTTQSALFLEPYPYDLFWP